MNRYIEQDNRIFYLTEGDPVLGRGSFKANHPGQLIAPDGLSVLDASRLPLAKLDEKLGAALAEGRLTVVNSFLGKFNIIDKPAEPDNRVEAAPLTERLNLLSH